MLTSSLVVAGITALVLGSPVQEGAFTSVMDCFAPNPASVVQGVSDAAVCVPAANGTYNLVAIDVNKLDNGVAQPVIKYSTGNYTVTTAAEYYTPAP